MTVYVVATLLTCLLAFAYERRKDLWWLMPLAALPLAVVASARWKVGTDFTRTYLPEYCALEHVRGRGDAFAQEKVFARRAKQGGYRKTPEQIRQYFVKVLARCEPGYRAVMEVAVWCRLGLRYVIGFCAALTAACVFFAIFRFSRWPSLAAFLYVGTGNYFLGLNIMRQYVAIGLLLVATGFVLDRRPWRFLCCVALAALFHHSAFLMLPCWLLGRMDLTPKRSVPIIVAALVLSFAAGPFVRKALVLAGADHYAHYFKSQVAADGFEWMFFSINVCFLALGAWCWDRACAGNRLFAVWYGMTVLGTVALALSGFVPLMKRVNYYYAAPQFLMLPEMLLAEEDVRKRRWLTALAVLVFAAETVVAVCMMNKNGVLPYRMR